MLTIQQARPADWPHIQSGLARTPLNEGALTSAVNATYLVAHEAGKFAGFCMVIQHGDVAFLPALFVETAFRSHGVAANLVANSIVYATASGTHWLFTGCQSEGIQFLTKYGFEVEQRELVPAEVLDRLEAAGGSHLTLMSMRCPRHPTVQDFREGAAHA